MATILLIDDESAVRQVLKEFLEAEGHQVIEAGNGSQGVALYKNKAIDLVILDILLPDKDGLVIIRELHDLNSQVNIIAMSGGLGTGSIDVLTIAQRLGANRVLPKPFMMENFLAVVKEALDGTDS
jgi:two-component system, chemotaxis family, chemotaxis protein CheY